MLQARGKRCESTTETAIQIKKDDTFCIHSVTLSSWAEGFQIAKICKRKKATKHDIHQWFYHLSTAPFPRVLSSATGFDPGLVTGASAEPIDRWWSWASA